MIYKEDLEHILLALFPASFILSYHIFLIYSQLKYHIIYQKNIALLTMPKPLTVTNCGKFLMTWKYQTTWPASCVTCMQIKKQQWEPDMKQQTGTKLGMEYVKAVYCHPDYLTCMQSISC